MQNAVLQAGELVPTVTPGATVGVLMKHGPEAAVLRGRTVRFTPNPADGRGTGRFMRELARRQG